MLKHLHMMLAVISITLFTLRFIWLMTSSDKQRYLRVQRSTYVIDSLLLVIGLTMAVQLSISPLEQWWFAEKLIAILAYIFTGYYTLKIARNRTMRIFGYLGAMGWVMLVVRLAMTKSPLFLA